jgi:hypothetical protein
MAKTGKVRHSLNIVITARDRIRDSRRIIRFYSIHGVKIEKVVMHCGSGVGVWVLPVRGERPLEGRINEGACWSHKERTEIAHILFGQVSWGLTRQRHNRMNKQIIQAAVT